MAFITARLKTVIKMLASEMLGKVNRYTKSFLKQSLGCTAYNPVPLPPLTWVVLTTPRSVQPKHSLLTFLFSPTLGVRHKYLNWKLFNSYCSQEFTYLPTKFFFRYLILSKFLGGLQPLWESCARYKSTHSCIVTNYFAWPTVHSPVSKEASMLQTVVAPQQLKDNPCSLILGPALNNPSA